MALRSNWKGYLKLSLVSCAVALYSAVKTTEKVRFNTLNRQTGNRVKRQFVDSVTEEAVDAEEQVKGYAVGRNDFVVVEDEELEAIALESTHTVDIERFVPKAEIDDRYRDNPYYIAPDDRVAEEPFAVIREAMRSQDMVGIARVVMARRERIMMLEPLGKGLLATTLRYPYELRAESTVFDEIAEVDVDPEMLDLAKDIIRRKAGHFQPEAFEDRYENALLELIRSKQAGQPPKATPAPSRPSNVVSLMDALRRSLEAEPKRRASEGEAPAKRTRVAAATAPRGSSKRSPKVSSRKKA
jgi:DNA end-binding protein Ku